MLHKEGFKILTNTLLILIALNIAVYTYLPNYYIFEITLVASLIIMFLFTQFFRNPTRRADANDNIVYSPVDGKIVVIEEVEESEYFKDKRLQVSVFMSPTNVHVTRHPIAGVVKYSKYHPGKYLVAWHPKASTENERTSVVVENENKDIILYRQVAGAVARRIVNYAKEGEYVAQGSDSGFIKFGSRVDVYLPLGTKVNVTLDEVVRGGETNLAQFS